MVGILIVCHGNLAEALIASVQILVGELPKVKGITIWPRERKEEIQERIERQIAEIDGGDGVVILTDLLGGTPTNLSLSFLQEKHVAVITGVNIPMLLALSSYQKEKSLEEIGRLVRKAGRKSILLAKKPKGTERREKWKRWYAPFAKRRW
jgi:PTS system mannose-specific IIA component